MNKHTIALILLIVACVALLGGCGSIQPPFGNVTLTTQQPSRYRIYVSGAVERDGYYEVEAGNDYFTVVQLAGSLRETVLPSLATTFIDGSVTELILGYYDGEARCDSINVNSELILFRIPIEGISTQIVNKLADYIIANGKITNRVQLQIALGDDYADNYYKLFIAEVDYEESN